MPLRAPTISLDKLHMARYQVLHYIYITLLVMPQGVNKRRSDIEDIVNLCYSCRSEEGGSTDICSGELERSSSGVVIRVMGPAAAWSFTN